MRPEDADELELVREQLRLFAADIKEIAQAEKDRREEAEAATEELRSSYLQMVKTLAMVCEMKDNYTRHHLDRTYQYAMSLTRRVAPEMAEDAAIGYGYLLHDIGKVGIPDGILNKQGPLDEDEWQIMRTHPLIGWQLVKPIAFLGDAIKIVRSHHERWDGNGYPEGRSRDDIYLPARIFAVVDTFDAMTSDRPYRRALPVEQALEEIDRHAGSQFDPDVVREFIGLCEDLSIADAESLSAIR